MKQETMTAAQWRATKGNPRQPRRKAGEMNKTEARFAQWLDGLKKAGLVRDWKYEAVKLTVLEASGKRRRRQYTPDFLVHLERPAHFSQLTGYVFKWSDFSDAGLFIEVKGFWREDALINIRLAAEKYPQFVFLAVQWKGGKWVWEAF